MNQRLDWLNDQIDLMQADKKPGPRAGDAGYQPDAGDVAALRMAAQLNARRPGAGRPNPEFLERLRVRVLESVVK